MEQITDMINKIDGWVWGWWMIVLLFGTHLFMTIRTGFIQKYTITKGIKLSVTKDTDGEGEVSQFGALATALAATIGTGNIVGGRYSHCSWRAGGSALVLAYRRIWNCHKVFGILNCSKIPGENKGRPYAGGSYVCP